MRIVRFLVLSLALVAAPACAQGSAPVLLVVGDSISAAYGLARGEGWVDLLAERLRTQGYRERVVNASISGDTTSGGIARLPALLREHRPSIVVIELGGNDALRGGNLQSTRANLDAMVAAVQAARAKPLILGMKVPPNYGAAYARAFDALFTDVAKARRVPVVPYLFEGFGEDLARFQPDRIHPTAAAQREILDNVWPALVPLLSRK
jgi:acyl-CoA thioesterase I